MKGGREKGGRWRASERASERASKGLCERARELGAQRPVLRKVPPPRSRHPLLARVKDFFSCPYLFMVLRGPSCARCPPALARPPIRLRTRTGSALALKRTHII